MIYEMRVYRCVPGRLPALLNRFATITLKLWDKHGIKQAGFFTTVVGESNQELTYFLAMGVAGRPRAEVERPSPPTPNGIAKRAETEKDGADRHANVSNQMLSADGVLVGEVVIRP
jgi:hypothetical protein